MHTSRNNHAAVLGSTLLTGGSQAVAALMAFVRSKVAAIYIGPEGVGIVGLLSQLQSVLVTGFDLGVSNSAVREISVLRANGNELGRSRLVRSLFRLATYTAIGCLLLGACICVPLARWMFNKDGYALDVALTSLSASLMLLAGAYSTIQRGHGLVRNLAIQRIVVAAGSSIAAYLGYRWFGLAAISCVLVISSLLGWLVAKVQSSGLRQPNPAADSPQIKLLVGHGLPFLWATLLFAVVSYLIGVLVVDYCGLRTGGNYQAAWGLTAYLVGFVLTAMGQDFLPRISAVIDKKDEAIAMINSQIEVGILLSIPGMFFFSAYADKLLNVFLSADFMQAAPIARCILLGCLGRVLNWPMLFTLNAQRQSKLHMIAVTVASGAYLLFAWVGLIFYGALGAACGFALMQALHFIWLRVVLFRTLGFRFNANVIFAAGISAAALAFAPYLAPYQAALVLAMIGSFSLWRLATVTGRGATLRSKIAKCFNL